jgi:hypothetical protein
MYLLLLLLLSGLELTRGQAGTDNLGLLYEGKSLEVATLIQSERVSLEFIINATEVEMRESFIKIKKRRRGLVQARVFAGNYSQAGTPARSGLRGHRCKKRLKSCLTFVLIFKARQ